MPRKWGFTCPDDGGVLLESPTWGDRLFCPNNRHGGNGAFFARSSTTEGWVQVTTGEGSGLTESQIRKMAAAQASAESDAAAEATVNGKRKPKAEKAAAPRAAAKSKDPRACECGCGENTKGGRFRPGHDAKLHSRQKAEAAALAAI